MARIPAEEKRKLFVEHYLKDYNSTNAAIAAGYSPNGADVTGSRLLADARTVALLDAHRAVIVVEKRDEREAIRQLLENAANLDLTDLVIMGKTGCSLKEFKDIPKHLRILITEITNVSGKESWKINFKVFNKEKAVEMLARIYGLDKGGGNNLTINNYGNLAAIVDSFPDD